MKLLAEKGKLHTVFTQNIDTLERMAGVPSDKIFEAHGSFATQHCIRCGAEYPDNEMDEHVKTAKVPRCKHKACTGLVKPDIVFFGEGLPDGFRDASLSLAYADLLIIMGTSLSVYPFAGLRDVVPDTCPRILINLDRVGDIGSRADDLVFQLTCDEAVRKLSDALGWREQLEKLWEATATSYTPRITKQPAPTTAVPESIKAATPLEDEVAELAKKLEKKMNVTDEETSFSVEASEEKPDDDVNEGGKVEVEPAEASGKPALVDTPHYEGGIKSVPQTKVEAKDKDAESGPSIAVA
ncbi:Sir2 histone deacetylase Hst2 [Tulasnella sp. 403]|nr:Sir2 histone deacetylase Hst2 [Tulasnella sp. 403]